MVAAVSSACTIRRPALTEGVPQRPHSRRSGFIRFPRVLEQSISMSSRKLRSEATVSNRLDGDTELYLITIPRASPTPHLR